MSYELGSFDVAVIGAGHAGCEAALAAARLGAKTALFTISLDGIANMPCNPSIGGTAKGHIVKEIDALGGEMGRVADATTLQSRMLNLGKGPAVHSLRVQADRVAYHLKMKQVLEEQPGLEIKQAEVVALRRDDTGAIAELETRLGAVYRVKAVILATGTYLNGKIHVGEASYTAGPDGSLAALGLTDSLREMGIAIRRFKTGTPARVHRRSIDFSKLERQDGDERIIPFSADTKELPKNILPCYIAYTNARTHQVILDNLHRSPLYSGRIEGIGPRYCPSIEDKIVRFSDKPRHQLFIEPMGLDTDEVYLQGMSSSLPQDVQLAFLRTIEGLENVEMMRNAYAIEYDCCDPTQLLPTLEFKTIPGLYGAGQFNGTSGYEEAAGQGLIAGINAALKLAGKPPVILDRASSYIGTLIDDLVTKGCMDPYRMMTSRSEYRLLLRQDNADERLTPLGVELGLLGRDRLEKLERKLRETEVELARLEQVVFSPSEPLNALLVSRETSPVTTGVRAIELLKRPQIRYTDLAAFDTDRPAISPAVEEQVEIRLKYDGYIRRQLQQVAQMRKQEARGLPGTEFDYAAVKGLRLEAVEKLNRIHPLNIGQASRISGVSPADLTVLTIWLEQKRRGEHE